MMSTSTTQLKVFCQLPLRLKAASLMVVLAAGLYFGPSGWARTGKLQPSYEFNKRLAFGINLGNALDAPHEGDWRVVLEARYFKLIKEAGFSHVRIPVRWSAHAANKPPYTVDPLFMSRVDWAVDQALANSLAVIVDMHHYQELDASPETQRERFLALWHQIAEQFKTKPMDVAFEIYNEPHKSLDSAKWNALMREALSEIRRSNADRIVVVGPVQWNDLHQLKALELPDHDRNLLVTFHYYEPFHFTHQGASWVGPESEQWLGIRWTGSKKEVSAIASDFEEAARWGKEHDRPLYLGEFGAYSKADMDSRLLWTGAVQAQALARGFSTAYWEFCSGYGVYDTHKNEWRQPLLNSLRQSK